MSGEEVAKAFVSHFYGKFANGGTQVRFSYQGELGCWLKRAVH